jgi:signal recognition particle receptor subunit beta
MIRGHVMTEEPDTQISDGVDPPRILSAFTGLQPLADKLRALDNGFQPFCTGADPIMARTARGQRRAIRDFEPSVTFIGQVKAGKTTLVNAICGWSGLLPADVNPWTSVVTALHMSPSTRRGVKRASFRFFSNEEWDNLLRQGGRVGEIAERAGAADEMAKVQEQLAEMREKSRRRLGDQFQLLLGQTHSYETLDAELIKRYVCMGDDFWDEPSGPVDQGRFADITKSADLWFGGPDLPLGLCVLDTPGVNDTFMIREQITLNALRGSRLCVMVLSAQQALSTVDLGLIRLISNVKARDVIIFVNRIDELSDPARDVPEIQESIAATLRKFDGPTDAEVIFGSAFWADHAVADTLHALGEEGAASLMSWARTRIDGEMAKADPRDIVWEISGVPALGRAISDRIADGAGQALIAKAEAALSNLTTGAQVFASASASPPGLAPQSGWTSAEIATRFDDIKTRAIGRLTVQLDKALETFERRTLNAQKTFLDRATGELLKHLEQFGEHAVWTYDPTGLRLLLRSAYRVYGTAANKAVKAELTQVAAEISAIFAEKADAPGDAPQIEPPPAPAPEAPVSLAQTIALDLKGSWWTRFWRRRRGYEAFADDFTNLIFQETAPLSQKLRVECVDAYAQRLQTCIADFVDEQRDMIVQIAQTHQHDAQSAAASGAA